MAVMRVLSLPGKRFRQNAYFPLFCEGLESVGVEIVDVKSKSAWLFRFDIVHVHFPEHYVTEQSHLGALKWTALYLSLFIVAKALGKRIVWTVHDVEPFKQRHQWLLKPYMHLFRSLVDGHVFLNTSSRAEFYARQPQQASKPSRVVPHGPYPVLENDQSRIGDRRRSLKEPDEAFLVGFLGDIKPYKNVAALQQLPTHLASGRPVKAVVAGIVDVECSDDLFQTERHLGKSLVRVDRRLDDHELSLLIQAVDVVFLPYERGSNSGFAMLVLSNGTRLLTSDLPMFQDLSRSIGSCWVNLLGEDEKLSDILEFLDGPVSQGTTERAEFLDKVSFCNGARILQKFYQVME